MIHVQLQEMLDKLEGKLKREVSSRIENQRKMHSHLHDYSTQIETNLWNKFDKEINQITQQVDALENNLKVWEPQLLRELTENREAIVQFDKDCQAVVTEMKSTVQSQFLLTEQYEQKVQERQQEFENRVFERELVQIENDRDKMEREMTKRILEFNFKVKEEATRLEDTVRAELNGLREEIDREQMERKANDESLLEGVKNFLINLQ